MNPSLFSSFRRSGWFKVLLSLLAAFVVYVLLGFFAAPPIIKWQMLKRLPITTKRSVSIRQVRVNPLVLSVSIRGLALTEPDGRPFASWEELYMNLQSSSLFRWAWTFKDIRLVQPFGEIILLPDGRLNFANMFDSPAKAGARSRKKQPRVPRINIFELQLIDGFLALRDETRNPPFHTQNRPINLLLQHFSTRPGIDTPYSFSAEGDTGRRLAWAGNVSVQPLRSSGHLQLTGIKLSRYQPYLGDFTHAQLTNGIADILIDYHFSADTNGTDLVVKNAIVHIEHVQLIDPETGETVAGLENLDAQQARLDLRERTAGLGSLKISQASALVRRKPNGHLNLLDLLRTRETPTNAAPISSPPTPSWTANVDNLAIEKTSVNFEDLALQTPFKTRFDPIEIRLKDFTTGTNSTAQYSFHMVTESAELAEGSGTLSINPLHTAGEIKWESINLKKCMPYAEAFFRGQLTGGKVAGEGAFAFSPAPKGFDAVISNLSVTITGLELKGPESDENIASIGRFAIEGAEASLAERRARIASIKSEQGSVLCRRHHDGSINLLQLVAPISTNRPFTDQSVGTAGSTTPDGTNRWTASIDEIALQDYTVKLEDQQPPKPAKSLLDQVALKVNGLSTVSNATLSARLDLRLNETGAVAAQGKAALEPLKAEVQLGLTNIDLRAAQPYLEDYVRLGILSGSLGGAFQAHYQTANRSDAQVKVRGQVNIRNFACAAEPDLKELMRWDDLAVSGIDAELEPTRLKVAEVKWIAPKTSIVIGADHRLNVASILKKDATASTNAAAQSNPQLSTAQKPSDTLPIQLDVVHLEKASVSITDESIEPHAKVAIQELSGGIKGLSTASKGPAEVSFAGKIDEQSPFAITGQIKPFAADLFVDLAISNANTQLTPLSTYMAKYAGHPLNRGRLSTDLRYHIEGKELKAQNKIYVEQLMLGSRNNSPDATTLPVKLGIALLKDSHGRIDLDVPVQGRIDDPKFRIAPIVLKVIVNMIAKAAESPFKLLGALVGGGGEEMSFVKFYPGGTNVVEGELDKLSKLSKALAQRPALSLEIGGAIDPVADREALARQKLREQLKEKQLHQLSSKGKSVQSVESLQLSPEDYNQLLRAAFAEKFGTNIAAILQTNQMALGTTYTPTGRTSTDSAGHNKQSLPKRVLSWVGLEGHGHQTKAEKHLPKADRLALRQLTPDQMETMLAHTVEVTPDDYQELMSARAHLVQTWLVQNAQVPNERLLLSGPKPVNADYQGESAVRLSLE